MLQPTQTLMWLLRCARTLLYVYLGAYILLPECPASPLPVPSVFLSAIEASSGLKQSAQDSEFSYQIFKFSSCQFSISLLFSSPSPRHVLGFLGYFVNISTNITVPKANMSFLHHLTDLFIKRMFFYEVNLLTTMQR